MKIGVVFPQIEMPADPIAVRTYAQTVEGLGYDYLLAYDHVLGANPDRPGGWEGRPYKYTDPFLEPFVLFGYWAGVTTTLEFAVGVIILPQRETALVAKQAAVVDVLTGGRFRFGVGVGWNPVEYEALGQNFRTRGKRYEEQIDLLRQLWTNELVTYKGDFHSIPDAGINPLPVQRPIPIWLGGHAEAALRRVAQIGDGWMTGGANIEQTKKEKAFIDQAMEEAGRDPATLGFDTWISANKHGPDEWADLAGQWQELGATHVAIETMRCGYTTPEQHLETVARFKEKAFQ